VSQVPCICIHFLPNNENLQKLHHNINSFLALAMPSATLPTTMKVLLQSDPASKTLFLATRPLPVPVPNSTEHLIRVHAAALTNGELLWMKNFPPPASETKGKELVPCYDMAGTVITAPSDSPFQPGTEVYGRTHYYRTAAGREYTICDTYELAFKPKTLSFVQAATVPMSVETAYQALFVQAPLQPVAGTGAKGKRIFVTAGSGAVGMVCIFSSCTFLFGKFTLNLRLFVVFLRQLLTLDSQVGCTARKVGWRRSSSNG
jgi:hypothetical protein